ncbi:hypothetical protein [Streptomyces agglomeratus]|uniref:hypothetical protein n=1 Tax=Streptomyces agglomeratus TaxID=285458 RepID=UPI000AD107BD
MPGTPTAPVPASPQAASPPAAGAPPRRRRRADPAGDVVRWAAFSCALVPVVLVVCGTSFGGAAAATLGLATVTAVCRVLLRRSERAAAEAAAAAAAEAAAAHLAKAAGSHRSGRHAGKSAPGE